MNSAEILNELQPVIQDLEMYAEIFNAASGSDLEISAKTLATFSGKLYDIVATLKNLKNQ